jgi:hypothetical protein
MVSCSVKKKAQGQLYLYLLNEIYNNIRIGKHLSDALHIQNGQKQGNGLSPLLFNLALEYA